MRSINKKALRELAPVIVTAACVVATAMVLSETDQLAKLAPQVGDIVAFVPSLVGRVDGDTRLLVHRQDQSGCVLDLNVLRHSGGSLIVESRAGGEPSSFRAHWAGGHTGEGPSDCGGAADLVVDRANLDNLSLAAGGYGVGAKRETVFFTSDIYMGN